MAWTWRPSFRNSHHQPSSRWHVRPWTAHPPSLRTGESRHSAAASGRTSAVVFRTAWPARRARPAPEHPWLCRDLLRWRQAIAAPSWELIAAHPDDSRVRRGWPGSVAERATRVWEERDRWFEVLDRLPRVMCHGDADRRNLFARD